MTCFTTCVCIRIEDLEDLLAKQERVLQVVEDEAREVAAKVRTLVLLDVKLLFEAGALLDAAVFAARSIEWLRTV